MLANKAAYTFNIDVINIIDLDYAVGVPHRDYATKMGIAALTDYIGVFLFVGGKRYLRRIKNRASHIYRDLIFLF